MKLALAIVSLALMVRCQTVVLTAPGTVAQTNTMYVALIGPGPDCPLLQSLCTGTGQIAWVVLRPSIDATAETSIEFLNDGHRERAFDVRTVRAGEQTTVLFTLPAQANFLMLVVRSHSNGIVRHLPRRATDIYFEESYRIGR